MKDFREKIDDIKEWTIIFNIRKTELTAREIISNVERKIKEELPSTSLTKTLITTKTELI